MTASFADLVTAVRSYNPEVDEDLLQRAHGFAVDAHGQQTRASGEPYVDHPIRVAGILVGYKVDTETVVGAMLHDTIEDSTTALDDIETAFGPRIAHLVDGVTKVDRIRVSEDEGPNAENIHKMMLAMAQDVRVLVIKLADRLHNMRTIAALGPKKQQRIARETLQIYAPLAARVGMQEMREELEDLAFEVLNPKARRAIMRRFVSLKHRTGPVTPRITHAIRTALADEGITAEVTGRDKRPYSIWRKAETTGVEFEQLSDISAFRVVVEETLDCYRALGVLHTRWPLIPGRLKDYISVAKPNGYQSLHTTVAGPDNERVEIQIRSRAMHDQAEAGIAAHWLYKAGGGRLREDPFDDVRKWIESVRESESPAESLEFAAAESLSGHVYCFTPKGRIIHLPRGATAVDFAFAVHTSIGHDCVGARIDGKIAPLFRPLKSGQEVEILRSRGSRPKPEWIGDVVTPRARQAIRRALREHEENEKASLGERLGKSAFRSAGHEPTARLFAVAAQRLGYASVQKLFSALGRSTVSANAVVHVLYPEADELSPSDSLPTKPGHTILGLRSKDAVTLAPCCMPLPGERIVGISERGRGIVVHAIDCRSLASPESDQAKWSDLRWDTEASAQAHNRACIGVIIANQARALARVCDVIGRHGANIEDLTMEKRRSDYFRVRFEIAVRDLGHLAGILASVGAESVVAEAVRMTGTTEGGA